jgi:hypothetical protein
MRSFSVCLGLACLGCTAKSPEPVVELPVIPVGSVVVLDGDPILYRDHEDSVGMALPERPSASYAVEVVAVAGTRLEVRTLSVDDPPACAGNFELADDYELRFWVEREDLRQVLLAPESFTSTDETKLELQPGVPVIDEVRGELGIAGQSVLVALADAQLGLAYQPAPMEFERPNLLLRSDTQLHFGDQILVGAVAPFTHATHMREVENSTPRELLLTFDNACGRFILRAPTRALNQGLYAMKGPKDAIPRMARNFDPEMVARNAGILGVVSSEGHFVASPYGGAFAVDDDDDRWGPAEAELAVECSPPRWTIASGVALSWGDGGPAGTVRRAHELPADARELGSRVCFEIDVFRLCADASKLGRKLDPNCQDSESPSSY